MKRKLIFPVFGKSSFLVLSILGLMFSECNSNKEEFLSEIGVCTGIENAKMLSERGFSYIEGSVSAILAPNESDAVYKDILAKIKLAELPVKSCNSFLPGSLKCVGPDAVQDEVLKYMETAFRRAKEVGVEYIVFGSSGSRKIPEGFSHEKAHDQFISLCSAMAPIAGKYGVTVVLEPLNTSEVNFINTVNEGGDIVRAVNHPNFKLLIDIYHMLRENEGTEAILENGDLIRHIHIAEKENRAAPGKHNEDFSPYFAALKKVGYKGRMSIECRWEDMATQSIIALETIQQQKQTK